jgi:hypothetical protein
MNNAREACGDEAVLAGHPRETGYDIYNIHIKKLSLRKSIDAVLELQCLYGRSDRNAASLLDLFANCFQVMCLPKN